MKKKATDERSSPVSERATTWTFLTNHTHVLLCIVEDPLVRMREIATRVGITERAVQRIVLDLEQGGYIEKTRDGRRNHYHVDAKRPLRHPVESHQKLRALVELARVVRPDALKKR